MAPPDEPRTNSVQSSSTTPLSDGASAHTITAAEQVLAHGRAASSAEDMAPAAERAGCHAAGYQVRHSLILFDFFRLSLSVLQLSLLLV